MPWLRGICRREALVVANRQRGQFELPRLWPRQGWGRTVGHDTDWAYTGWAHSEHGHTIFISHSTLLQACLIYGGPPPLKRPGKCSQKHPSTTGFCAQLEKLPLSPHWPNSQYTQCYQKMSAWQHRLCSRVLRCLSEHPRPKKDMSWMYNPCCPPLTVQYLVVNFVDS